MANYLPMVPRANQVPLHQCFFKGSISTRRTHIARNPSHFPLYRDRCNSRGIKMHDRAIPQEYKTAAGDRHVPFLDSFLIIQSHITHTVDRRRWTPLLNLESLNSPSRD